MHWWYVSFSLANKEEEMRVTEKVFDALENPNISPSSPDWIPLGYELAEAIFGNPTNTRETRDEVVKEVSTGRNGMAEEISKTFNISNDKKSI